MVLAVFTAYVLYVSWTLDPDPRGYGTHERLGLAPCSFKAWTGVPCLTCGMTTAFAHMAHFQLLDAFAVQPAGAVFFVMAVLYVPAGLWAAARGRSLFALLDRLDLRRHVLPFLALLLGAWVYTILVQTT
ncbi:MAG: DUF2752 domain-containing protein [Planctomycetes bacterium]|nr:DUF2752 domain-containing protein [Planctomycetota bacterium]